MPAPSLKNANIPAQDPLVGEGGYITSTWNYFLTTMLGALNSAPAKISVGSFQHVAGSTPATDISAGITASGLYFISYYASITQAATVNSTLTVTLAWTDHGQAKTKSATAITSNVVTDSQSGFLMVYSDGNSPVTIEAAYGSTGATHMEYSLWGLLLSVST